MNENWKAPDWVKLPEFIICGAMKSGTSSLHDILNSHPNVFIPNREIHFFDIDNILEHPDFSFYHKNHWVYQSIDKDPKKYWRWYSNHFIGGEGKILGEDSTNYLCCSNFPNRLNQQNKDIKLVIMLRNPISRAYSNYFHNLRTGRAIWDFEKTLLYDPKSILERSKYGQQIENIYNKIPRERVKIVLFEEFLANKETSVKEICEFLELDYAKIDKSALAFHSNRASIPSSIRIQVFRNRIFRDFGNSMYHGELPEKLESDKFPISLFKRSINRFLMLVNPSTKKGTPPMNTSTEQYLKDYFKDDIKLLSDLMSRDLIEFWGL